MKKIRGIICLLALIPIVANAAWWNPMTWTWNPLVWGKDIAVIWHAPGGQSVVELPTMQLTATPAELPELPAAPSSTAIVAATTTEERGVRIAPKALHPTSTPKSLVTVLVAATNRAPISERLNDQKALASEVVAIVCVKPQTAGTEGALYMGTGIIMNSNGYILTNGHVLGDSTACYVGRKRDVIAGLQNQSGRPAPTIALYYSLKFIGKGNAGVPDPTEDDWLSSHHDFAILKIGDKIPRDQWQTNHPATPEIRALNDSLIPWATDAEYADFPASGPLLHPIAVNFDYHPVIGDLLSLGGFIGSTGLSNYTFSDGKLEVIGTSTITVAMPTGQGFSGSPVVDNRGNFVGLNFASDCVAGGGCLGYIQEGVSAFFYGNNSLALSVPFLDKAMKEDLGFGLKELAVMQ